MQEIKGVKFKLAGIDVYQKGTLVDVFARFAGVDETLEQITAPAQPKPPKTAAAGTVAAILEEMEPMSRMATMPSLSVSEITEAIVGDRDLQHKGHEVFDLFDKQGILADLGTEKLAQVLIEMGKARNKILEQGQHTFVPTILPKQDLTPKP